MNTEIQKDIKILLSLLLTSYDPNQNYKYYHDIIDGGIKFILSKYSYSEALLAIDQINDNTNIINTTNTVHNNYCICGAIHKSESTSYFLRYCQYCINDLNTSINKYAYIIDTINICLGFNLHTFVKPIKNLNFDMLILQTYEALNNGFRSGLHTIPKERANTISIYKS